jgi:hypothetical protein
MWMRTRPVAAALGLYGRNRQTQGIGGSRRKKRGEQAPLRCGELSGLVDFVMLGP